MLIGIAGTLGAGKGTIAQYLASKHRFLYLSVRAFFAAELSKAGQLATRESIAVIAEKIRAEHGATYPLEQLLANSPKDHNIVIESIRTINEAQFLKMHGDALWAVDASVESRFKRASAQTVGSTLTLEEFKKSDEVGMHSDNPDEPNFEALKALASHVFDASGTKEELYAQVDKALLELNK